jgi:hypothetical protein
MSFQQNVVGTCAILGESDGTARCLLPIMCVDKMTKQPKTQIKCHFSKMLFGHVPSCVKVMVLPRSLMPIMPIDKMTT